VSHHITETTRTTGQKLDYAVREIGILVAAGAVWTGSSLGMEEIILRSAAPAFDVLQVKQALMFTGTAFGFCNIIAAYMAIRCARWVRSFVPELGDESAAFDAYGMVTFCCWGSILYILVGLPWSTLWSAS